MTPQTLPRRAAPAFLASALPFCFVAAGLLVAVPVARAQRSAPTEYEVKAAYLYYFGKFVEWPPRPAGADATSFVICVLGNDPFGPALDKTVAGETIGSKTVVVKRVAKPQEALGCRVVFISASEAGRLAEVLTALDRSAILTVSDLQQFTRRGGMIQFMFQRSRVRFEVNLAAAQHAGLSLNSELLKVAVAVRKKPRASD